MTLANFLLARRLLPQQIIRLDGELFLMLSDMATAQGQTVSEFVCNALYNIAYDARAQTKNDRRWAALTPREQQVAALACLGHTNAEIAEQLVISVNTVRSHMRNILDKFHASSKVELRLALAEWNFRDWLEAQQRADNDEF